MTLVPEWAQILVANSLEMVWMNGLADGVKKRRTERQPINTIGQSFRYPVGAQPSEIAIERAVLLHHENDVLQVAQSCVAGHRDGTSAAENHSGAVLRRDS